MIWEVILASFLFPFWAWVFRAGVFYVLASTAGRVAEKKKEELTGSFKEFQKAHDKGAEW